MSLLCWKNIHVRAFSISEDPTIAEPGTGYVFERRTSRGNGIFALLSLVFKQIFGQIVFLRVKTLCNTNVVASRLIKREKRSLPDDVRRRKTSVVKLPQWSSPVAEASYYFLCFMYAQIPEKRKKLWVTWRRFFKNKTLLWPDKLKPLTSDRVRLKVSPRSYKYCRKKCSFTEKELERKKSEFANLKQQTLSTREERKLFEKMEEEMKKLEDDHSSLVAQLKAKDEEIKMSMIRAITSWRRWGKL